MCGASAARPGVSVRQVVFNDNYRTRQKVESKLIALNAEEAKSLTVQATAAAWPRLMMAKEGEIRYLREMTACRAMLVQSSQYGRRAAATDDQDKGPRAAGSRLESKSLNAHSGVSQRDCKTRGGHGSVVTSVSQWSRHERVEG